MIPIICTLGPLHIYSYGLMLAVAFFVSSALAARYAKQKGVSADIISGLAFTGFLAGIIGARLLYVLQNLSDYLQNPLEIFALQHGGLSWFGGFIAGVCAGIFYLKKRRTPVLQALDILMPYVALGQAIGRIGCFLTGAVMESPLPMEVSTSRYTMIHFCQPSFIHLCC